MKGEFYDKKNSAKSAETNHYFNTLFEPTNRDA